MGRRLGLRTEDGTDELVLALERARGVDGRPWVRVRLPVRPVGSTGWVPREALERLIAVKTWLRVDTRRLRATLVRSGRVVFRARVAVGQARWPTPRGEFYIRNKLVGFPRGTVYGALAFGTSARSEVLTDWPQGGVVGIHGTNRPELIPGRVSHGCVRMRNRDILRLARLMPVGTPLTIR
ncbi:MAG: L,D-transpeptidase [Actinomycetota bacterium]|nr:L,D-transpeptidase [Actinomycetota bacterium]